MSVIKVSDSDILEIKRLRYVIDLNKRLVSRGIEDPDISADEMNEASRRSFYAQQRIENIKDKYSDAAIEVLGLTGVPPSLVLTGLETEDAEDVCERYFSLYERFIEKARSFRRSARSALFSN